MRARAQTRSGLSRRFCACRFAFPRIFDRCVVRDVLEHGKAVRRFRHPGEVEAALRTWLGKRMLLLIQFVRLVPACPQHGQTRIRRVLLSSKLVMMSSMIAPERTAHC